MNSMAYLWCKCSLYTYVGWFDMAVVNTKQDHMRCEIRNRLCSRCDISHYSVWTTEYSITQVHIWWVHSPEYPQSTNEWPPLKFPHAYPRLQGASQRPCLPINFNLPETRPQVTGIDPEGPQKACNAYWSCTKRVTNSLRSGGLIFGSVQATLSPSCLSCWATIMPNMTPFSYKKYPDLYVFIILRTQGIQVYARIPPT